MAFILLTVCCYLLGSCRAVSPLNAVTDSSTQYGDHSQRLEVLPPAGNSPCQQQDFGDRGDAWHDVLKNAPHELTSPKPISVASFVGQVSMSENVMPTLTAGKGPGSLDVTLIDKPVQPEIAKTVSSAAVEIHNKYESGDETRSDVSTVSRSAPQNMLSTEVSSADKRLNWEALFMPYRRNDVVGQMLQSVPVAVASETGNQTAVSLATVHEGFLETCTLRQYSEEHVAGLDFTDGISVDNTSVWVMQSKCL